MNDFGPLGNTRVLIVDDQKEIHDDFREMLVGGDDDLLSEELAQTFGVSSDETLLPAGLDARFREGAELVRTHCLSCHKVNGFGGAKFEGNLAEIVKDYGESEFLRLVLTPAAAREGATMPALPDRLSEAERRRIAEAILAYLRAVPVQP